MTFVRLRDEQRRRFDEDGFLIVRDALDAPATARLIASDSQALRHESVADGSYDGFRNVVALDDAFVPLLTHAKTVGLIVQLMGPNLQLMMNHLIYKHPEALGTPPTRRTPGWHRDIAGTSSDLGYDGTPRLETNAYYLTDLSAPRSGATDPETVVEQAADRLVPGQRRGFRP